MVKKKKKLKIKKPKSKKARMKKKVVKRPIKKPKTKKKVLKKPLKKKFLKKRKVKINKTKKRPKAKTKTKVKVRVRIRPKPKKKPVRVSRPRPVPKKVVPKKKPKRTVLKPKDHIFDGVHRTKIRVIGIGGGGGTIVSEIISRVKKADFYVANTDAQALRELSRIAKRFQFGQNLTKGLGTGMNVELGEQAAQEEKDKIEKILEGQDLVIIIACLGGGTSSGAAPVFARISKNLGNITYGIFTLPFEFEGEKKMEAALESLEKIKSNVNVYTVIPNERIFQVVDKNTPLKDALSAINKNLAENLEGLIEMIYMPGLINIDFADLKTVLSGKGRLVYLNTIETEDPNKEEIIKKLISNPLYPYTIKGAKGILYDISSDKNIQLSEVSQISNVISNLVNKNAKIIFGISQNQKYQDRIKVTLLASGCSAKEFLEKMKNVKKSLTSVVEVLKRTKIKKIKKKVEKILEKKTVPVPEKEEKPKKKTTKVSKPKPVLKKPEPKPVKKPSPKPSETAEKVPMRQKPKINLVQDDRVRKNALQVRREVEEEEKEILEREKVWEIPAILRRGKEEKHDS